MTASDWDAYFFKIAEAVASNTKCMSRKVGAVIVRDKFIVSTGFNGPVSHMPPCDTKLMWLRRGDLGEELLRIASLVDKNPGVCPRKLLGYKSGEGLNYCSAAHAERNAIDLCARMGCATDKCVMYLNCGVVCLECAKSIVMSGISEVVVTSLDSYDVPPLTGKLLLAEAGVHVRLYRHLEGVDKTH